MEEEWLSISEVEKSTGIPDRTIRRYVAQHGHHLNTRKIHRNYLIARNAVAILTTIRDQYKHGRNSDQIEAALSESGVPMTITVNSDEDGPVSLAESLIALRQKLGDSLTLISQEQHQMRKEMEFLRDEIAERLDRQETLAREMERERNRMLDFRDKELVLTIRKILEAKRQTWWRKLTRQA
jgi:DNA-binding transcriptional MerR regulator